MNFDSMQTYLIPLLYGIYAFLLLFTRPARGTGWAFCSKRAKKNETTWRFAQIAAGLYCLAAAAILLIAILLIGVSSLVQLLLELVLVVLIYPAVSALLKKKFPD